MTKDYLEGAKFIYPEKRVDERKWPRNPEDYHITMKFRNRFRQFGSIMNGDVIRDAIEFGELVQADKGCVAFVNDLGGVVFYIVVTHDDNGSYPAVTIWPYVYDRDEALDTGRWSARHLNKIQSLANEDFEEHYAEYVQEIDGE